VEDLQLGQVGAEVSMGHLLEQILESGLLREGVHLELQLVRGGDVGCGHLGVLGCQEAALRQLLQLVPTPRQVPAPFMDLYHKRLGQLFEPRSA